MTNDVDNNQELSDMHVIITVMNELKAIENDLVRSECLDILKDATELHRLYHQFSMREKVDGDFDRTLVSLLNNVVKQLPKGIQP